MVATTLSRLNANLPLLARSEQRVGRILLRDPAEFARLTISEVASLAYVSKTTVVRFCHSLGYAGFVELRASVDGAGRATQRPAAVRRLPYARQVIGQFLRWHATLDDQLLVRVHAALAACARAGGWARVFLPGAQAATAALLAQKRTPLQLVVDIRRTPAADAGAFRRGDVVCIGALASRWEPGLDALCEQARAAGAFTVAIVSSNEAAAAPCDARFVMKADVVAGSFNASVLQLVALEAVLDLEAEAQGLRMNTLFGSSV